MKRLSVNIISWLMITTLLFSQAGLVVAEHICTMGGENEVSVTAQDACEDDGCTEEADEDGCCATVYSFAKLRIESTGSALLPFCPDVISFKNFNADHSISSAWDDNAYHTHSAFISTVKPDNNIPLRVCCFRI